MNKLISILLVIILIAAPMSAFAAETDDVDGMPFFLDSSPVVTESGVLFYSKTIGEKVFKEGDEFVSPVEGISRDGNTYTLDNVNDDSLTLGFVLQGDVSLVIKGDCVINSLVTIGGNGIPAGIHLMGDGSLTVKGEESLVSPVVRIFAGKTDSRLIIDRTVTFKTDCNFSFSLSDYGVKNADAPVVTFGGKKVEGIKSVTAKKLTLTEKAAFISKTPTQVGVKIKSNSDPDGVYGAKVWHTIGKTEKVSYEIFRYIYSEELGAYIVDPDFETVKADEGEVESLGYTLCKTVPSGINYLKTYYHREKTSNGWHAGYEVKNPDDPDSKYVLSDNFYDDMTYSYGLEKYELDEETGKYKVVSDKGTCNVKTFIDYGFEYVLDEKGKPERLDLGTGSVVYRVTCPDDPDAVYGYGHSTYEDVPLVCTLRKVEYNDENSRYEIDETFAEKKFTKEEFEKSGLTYVAKSYSDEPLELNYAEVDNFTVVSLNDSDTALAKYSTVYARNGEATLNGEKITLLRRNYTLYRETFPEKTKEIELDNPHFYIQDKIDLEGVLIQDISSAEIKGLKSKTYTGKAQTQKLTVTLGGEALTENVDYTLSYKNNKSAGTASLTIKGIEAYKGTVTKTFKIKKAANPIKVSVNAKSVKASKLKKAKVSVKKAITVKDKKGAVSYKKVSGSKKLKISSKGVITAAKGTYKKNTTLKIKVKVTAKGNSNYKKASKNVTVKIKVK